MSYSKFLLLIFLFFSFLCSAQETVDADKKDETYWNLVLAAREAQDLMARDRVDSIANLIVEYGEEKNNQDYIHYGLFFKAEALTRSKPNEAIEFAKKSLAYFEKKEDHSKCSRISNALGHGYSNIGDTETALEFYQKAIRHSEQHEQADHKKEIRFRSGTLYNMGFALLRKGDLTRAAEYLYDALEVIEPYNDSMLLASVNVQLGNIETMRNQFDDALLYFKKSLSLSNVKCTSCKKISLLSIAGSFQEMEQLDSALYYYDIVIPLVRSSNDVYSLCVGLYNMSDLYITLGRPDEALKNAQEVLELSRKRGFKNFEVGGYYVLANAHHKLENDQKARVAIDNAISRIENQNEYHTRSAIYELASEIYERRGDYEKAFSYQKSFKTYSDSLLNKESLAKIDELTIAHETKEKEGKIKELEKEKELSALQFRQNITLWIGFFLICGLCAGLYILYINRKRLIAKKQKDSIEQRLLRSQMNPHFIFNAISSIQNYLFEKSETKTALNYLSKFAKLMRQILENSREEYIPLSDEIDTLNNYLELQQLRYNNTFGYEIILDQKLQNQDLLVPPLIAQPFVENAIEHGLIYRRPNGQVKIEFKSEDENLVLSIEDNGVGKKSTTIAPATNENKKSPLATVITKERLNLISEATKNKFEMIISELKTGGTLVTIQLPKVIAS